MGRAYIISTCAISPQTSFEEALFLKPMVSVSNGQLYNQPAPHHLHIGPVAIRRMSKLLKDGITAGLHCLQNAGIVTPDAIITGTSRGSVTDMENFMKEMALRNEEALNPTSFIQSTYNSVNGWLALTSGCRGYNQTYVHRGFSFELALQDVLMTLAENSARFNILAGCFDELTAEYFSIRQKVGFFKTIFPDSNHLLEHYHTSGTIAGEGASFFLFSNTPAKAFLAGIRMLYQPTTERANLALLNLLAENNCSTGDIDVVVSGMNGDARNYELMNGINSLFSAGTAIVAFKHLCGEYASASGFGLWIANYIMEHQSIPDAIVYRPAPVKKIETVLLCNVTMAMNISLILLKSGN